VIPLDVSQLTANATGFTDSQIWIGIFGQLITIPNPGEVPPPGPTYYLDAGSLRTIAGQMEPDPQSTGLLSSGPDTPDSVTLPSSTLADWGGNLSLPVPPEGEQYTGRIVISVGAPVQAQVNSAGSVSSPSAANPTDPSSGTFYDFLEFTITNKPVTTGGVTTYVPEADIDTSQVDSFGLPLQLQFFQDAAGTTPYPFGQVANATNATPIVITSTTNHNLVNGDVVTISGVEGNTAANGAFPVTVIDATSFQLNGNASVGNGAYTGGGFWTTGGGPVGVSVDRNTVFTGTTDNGYLKFVRDQIIAGNENAGPFLESFATRPNSATHPITGATNATPIVITSANHGLTTGEVVNISGVGGNTAANGIFTITVVDANTFQLDDSAGNGAFTSGGTWSSYSVPLRLVSPKDVAESLTNTSTDPINTYFDSTLDDFFLQYLPSNQTVSGQAGGGQTFTITSQASGTEQTYTGTVQLVGGNYILRLTSSDATDTTNYDIYYPFFTTNLPTNYTPLFTPGPAPSWITGLNKQNESPTTMVFACDGVFADNTVRPGFNNTQSAILGDLENSLSAGLNRGIALNSPSTWGDTTSWYPTNGIYNYWVQYWHQDGLAFNNQAYAFPYDDKFGTSTNLQQDNVGLVKITLGTWGSTGASTTSFTNFPATTTQSGMVTLEAQVTGTATPTGTVTFYIDGVPVNSTNSGPSPLPDPVTVDGTGKATLTANLPALPDGGHTHTYTVTAVYSGDASNGPSIAYQELQLTGSLGDFNVTMTPGSGPLGTSVAVAATLPGVTPTGSVAFSIVDSMNNTVLDLGSTTVTTNPVTRQVLFPTNLLTFTGDTTLGSNTITNVSSLANIIIGQKITGAGIPAGATVTGFTPANNGQGNSVQLSGNATATATGITFTSDAASVVYRVKAVYDTFTGYGNFTVTPGTGLGAARPEFIAVGGSNGSVRILNAITGDTIVAATGLLDVPGGSQYKGLVEIAFGDLNGDSVPDLFIAAANPAGVLGLANSKAGRVFVYDGATLFAGTVPTTTIGVFTPFAKSDGPAGSTATYRNGLNIAVADVDGDGQVDLIAGTRSGTATAGQQEYGRFVVIDGASPAGSNTMIGGIVKPFGNTYEKGVVVAGGDLDGDGDTEIAVTRGGPVASTNPNKTVKLKAFQLDGVGTSLSELNLSGTGSPLAPFAGIGSGKSVIDRDARVAFVDQDGDGSAELVFSALDPVTDPSNTQVRIATFSVDTSTGLATAVSTGTGPSKSYLVGTNIEDHAITHEDIDGDGTSFLALITESATSQIQYLDPVTGIAQPENVTLSLLEGGVAVDGI